MSTQGDAPAGYCPGVPVGEQDRPCWDGGKQTCFPCLSPLMTHGACSGVGASPAPPPLPVCVDDAGCARRNTRCDPGHPYRNEQGCRPLGCDEGAQCPTGMVCDPSSPLANPPFLRLVPGGAPAAGCRLLSCDDPGAPSCQTNAVRCSDPGGTPCAAGSVCDARQPGLGCRPLACNEAGATPCSDGAFCAAVAPGSFACVECLTNEDCGCGSCIGRVCYNRPGYCEPGCA